MYIINRRTITAINDKNMLIWKRFAQLEAYIFNHFWYDNEYVLSYIYKKCSAEIW